MKYTSLYDEHVRLGAKIVPFAGYAMPVQYQGITVEHEAVRRACGLFDVSHMGEFIVKGDHAGDFLNSITSNDVSRLVDGKAQYSCLPNADGGIIDDLLVYRIDLLTYMLVVNASNIEKDLEWIELCRSENTAWEDVSVKDISDRTALIAVQGPRAGAALQKLTEIDLNSLSYYSFKRGTLASISNVIVSATGYTGAGGFELYFDAVHAPAVWTSILEAGKAEGIMPAGLGARDTLRLEMGYCLYGNDIDGTTSPLEAGLGWITKLTKDFTARNILQTQKDRGISRRLVGFVLDNRAIPRHGYEITDLHGHKVGVVTSGTHSPSLQQGIGMGYVDLPHNESGTHLYIIIRDKAQEAQVVPLPFYKK